MPASPAEKSTAQQQIEAALLYLAGRCDRAHSQDGVGFSGAHATVGKRWADYLDSRGRLSLHLLAEVLDVLRTYERTQLNPAGYVLPAEAPALPPPAHSEGLQVEVRRVIYKSDTACLVACLPSLSAQLPPGATTHRDRFCKAWLPLEQLDADPTGRVVRLTGEWIADSREPGRLLLQVQTVVTGSDPVERWSEAIREAVTLPALEAVRQKIAASTLSREQRDSLVPLYRQRRDYLRTAALRCAGHSQPPRDLPSAVPERVGLGNYDY